jgi:cytochrome c-type biogenesis protein CcmH/NrfF
VHRGAATAAAVTTIILILLSGISAVHAQVPPTQGPGMGAAQHDLSQRLGQKKELTPSEVDVLRHIACMCGGCLREPLSSCKCGFADGERDRVRGWMAEGKTKDEIISAYVAKYGPTVLTFPKSPAAWAVPVGAGVLALGLVVGLGRRWTRKRPKAVAPGAAPVAAGGASEYDERLDDELRDLD